MIQRINLGSNGRTSELSTAGKDNGPGAVAVRLTELGIVLPEPKKPVGKYRSTLVIGDRLKVSGHGPWVDGKPIKGKLYHSFEDHHIQYGRKAARQVGLGILSSIDAEVGLDRIERIVETVGFVACTADFYHHPQVIDGFSDLMEEVFGEELGRGVRTAIGVESLPFGIVVEIKCEFLLKP